MNAFVTLHDSIDAADVNDVLLMVIEALAERGGASIENIVALHGNLSNGWVAESLSAHVLLFDAPSSDAALLRSVTSFLSARPFLFDISVDQNLEITFHPIRNADEFNLERTERLLANGFPKPASELAGATRRYLQDHARALPAAIADSLRCHMLLSDCIERCRTPIFPDAGAVLCKRGIDTDLNFFLKTYLENLQNLVTEHPNFATALSEQIQFTKEGINLLKVAFRTSSPQYAIFSWLSIYLLRLAYHRYSINDTAEAIALLTRSVECYSTYYLAEANIIRFDSGSFVWNTNDEKVLGTGPLLGELLKRVDSSSSTALFNSISTTEAMVKIRNRSIYGHGVQKVTKQVFENYYSGVRQMLEIMESTDPLSKARWSKLWQLSTPPDLGVLRTLVGTSLEKFQRHGRRIAH